MRRDRALRRTKCCRTETERFSSVHSPSLSFLQVFGRLALLRGKPVCFRQHLHCISGARRRSGIGICFAGLIGCNRLRVLYSFVNIYIHSCLSVSMSICVFCVDGPCPCVYCSYVSGRLSLSLSPSTTCSSVQDPGGPASFLHARS